LLGCVQIIAERKFSATIGFAHTEALLARFRLGVDSLRNRYWDFLNGSVLLPAVSLLPGELPVPRSSAFDDQPQRRPRAEHQWNRELAATSLGDAANQFPLIIGEMATTDDFQGTTNETWPDVAQAYWAGHALRVRIRALAVFQHGTGPKEFRGFRDLVVMPWAFTSGLPQSELDLRRELACAPITKSDSSLLRFLAPRN